jgi:IclR family transcriptional regulator, pca regulon regulatory protein
VSSVDKEQFVTSLARGLTVLKAFGPGSPEMTLSEVAAAAGLSPAVTRRFLLTLVRLGYVAQTHRKFVLTPRVMELAASYLDSMNLAEIAHPHLQQIRDSTGDSVSLTALDGVDIIHLCHVQTERLLRFAVTPGSRVPAYVSGTGHVILAFEPESRLEAYFARAELTPRTPRTVTSEAELRERLGAARKDGYAVVVDELDIGITVIGYPIMKDGVAVAGVSCAIASGYLPVTEFVESRLPLLRSAAVRLQKELERFPALLHSLDMSRPSGY